MALSEILQDIFGPEGRLVNGFSSLGNPEVLIVMAILLFGFSAHVVFVIFGMLIILATCIIVRLVSFRPRPNKVKYATFLEKIKASSFPSFHSATSCFAFLFFSAFEQSMTIKLTLVALIMAVGGTRILLKKHDLYDVSGGWALGLVIYLAASYVYGSGLIF